MFSQAATLELTNRKTMEDGSPSGGEQHLPMAAQMKGRLTKRNARLLPARLHIVLQVPAGIVLKAPLLTPSSTGKELNVFDLLT